MANLKICFLDKACIGGLLLYLYTGIGCPLWIYVLSVALPPPPKKLPPTKKAVALSLIVVTLAFGLGFREASPNVSGRKCPEWDRRTLQSTSLPERCMPAFPLPVQVSLGIHALLLPLWKSACDHLEAPWGDPQPMQVWLGSRTWSDQAWATMVMIWLGWPWQRTWDVNHCPFWAVGLKRQVCVTPSYFIDRNALPRDSGFTELVKGAESSSNNLVDRLKSALYW